MNDIGMSPDYRNGVFDPEYYTCTICDRPVHWTIVQHCTCCQQPVCPACSETDKHQQDCICTACRQSMEEHQ